MLRGDIANDVHIFESRLPIKPQIGEILPEKSKPFAEKEDGNQREYDHGDESVAAKERLDYLFPRPLHPARFGSGRNEDAGIGDALHEEGIFREASGPRQFV